MPLSYPQVLNGEVLLERLKLAIEIFVARAAIRGMPSQYQLHGELAHTVYTLGFSRHNHAG